MASATDIITYIGVPLAVLVVTPILYAFVSTLYMRSKLERVLRKNKITCQIRARLMTGVVEADLPVYHLSVLSRDEPAYWLQSTSSLAIDGTSWSSYNFHTSISESISLRLQRSDRITLPAAEIDFQGLLVYLVDRGYFPNQEGFRTLRSQRQQTSDGTVLMETTKGGIGRRLCFAKPGARHGSIILKFSDEPNSRAGLVPSHRDSTNTLPPFHLTGSLLEPQHDDPPTNYGPDPTDETQNLSANAERLRYFVMRWAGPLGLEISTHEKPQPSAGTELPADHILSPAHPDNDSQSNETLWGQPLTWFACAAIAVYGFNSGMPKPFYVFRPNERYLYTAKWFSVEVSAVLLHNLIRPYTQDIHECLIHVDPDQYDIMGIDTSETSRQSQPADRSAKVWVTKAELKFMIDMMAKFQESHLLARFAFEIEKLARIFKKHIDIPNLLRMCIQSLSSHPIRFKSLSIGTLPQGVSSLRQITQHTADQIFRMAILDTEFARGVRDEIHELLLNPLASALKAAKASSKGKKLDVDQGDARTIWISGLRSNQERRGFFCCAIVLLAVARQRADYLRSGDDIRQCVSDSPRVHLS